MSAPVAARMAGRITLALKTVRAVDLRCETGPIRAGAGNLEFSMKLPFAIATFLGFAALLAAAGDRLYHETLQFTPPRVESIEDVLIRLSIAEGLPPSIALNRAWLESRFRPGLVSATGDHGVMQLNQRYFPAAPRMTVEENLTAGVHLLARYWHCYRDPRLVHIAYRRGPAAAGRCKS